MVRVRQARRHSREEKHTPTQKCYILDPNKNPQQTQQKLQNQSWFLSQGQHQQLHFPNSFDHNQTEQKNGQKLWNRCLRERQQIHQYQRENEHGPLQKQYQHFQQLVQPGPLHWQFIDEVQRVQNREKQEKLLQERRQQLRDQIQEQSQTEPSNNEEECPIPPEYRQAQDLPVQQPLNSRYQPQVPRHLAQSPQALNQHRCQQAHCRHQPPQVQPLLVLYHPQPQYQVWHHQYYKPWHPSTRDILRTLEAQYQHLVQQVQQLREQQAQDIRREQQLQLREREKQIQTIPETMIPDNPLFPFVMYGDSDDSEDEGGRESEEDKNESQDKPDKSDNDIGVKDEEDKEENEEDEVDNMENESGFVMI